MKEEKESDDCCDGDEEESQSQSQAPCKEEDFCEAFNKSQNCLMNFLQMTQKTKEKNFLSQKELKAKFKINFTTFPNTDEILITFNKILKRFFINLILI